MRKLRNKINWVLLPIFIFGLISIFLENIYNIKFPNTSNGSIFDFVFINLWFFSIPILIFLNIGIPIGRIGYKRRFWGKRTIEKILNMDKRKKKKIDIICWILMAIDIIVMVSFEIMSNGDSDDLPRDLGIFHGFFIPFWGYQFLFNFAYPLIRGDFNKYLY